MSIKESSCRAADHDPTSGIMSDQRIALSSAGGDTVPSPVRPSPRERAEHRRDQQHDDGSTVCTMRYGTKVGASIEAVEVGAMVELARPRPSSGRCRTAKLVARDKEPKPDSAPTLPLPEAICEPVLTEQLRAYVLLTSGLT